MKVSEADLLKSGFSNADLLKIKTNTQSYGGSLAEAIQDLANRFILASSVVLCCLAIWGLLIIFGSDESVFAGSIGLLCGIAVVVFIQSPILAYKSWRYRRLITNSELSQ
ncbi:hypothetical protein [Pantoea sp. FN0305]|uniref:hypothetical protein n=1 Tax=Pantoea sp. FN0305 TaxID=3418559 RepID=UPI003CEFF8B0